MSSLIEVAQPAAQVHPTTPRVDNLTLRQMARSHREVSQGGAVFLRPSDIDRLAKTFEAARQRVAAERYEDPTLRTACEWLLDNYHLLKWVLIGLRLDLPAGYQRQLPRIGDEAPRVRAVAEALLDSHVEFGLDNLEDFVAAYQMVTSLTIGELWALPVLIRLVVVQRYAALLEDIEGEASVAGSDVGLASGRAVRSLRLLAEVDYKRLFCRLSATEEILREDPAGAYPRMDFDTADQYRGAVEELARLAGKAETDVARGILARTREEASDGRRGHVGYWLVGAGRIEVERSLGASSRTVERRVLNRPRLSFFGMLTLVQVGLLAPVAAYLLWLRPPWSISLLCLLLCWIPASVPAVTFVHWMMAKLVRPRRMYRLDFSKAIPSRWRTLVAVPTLLTSFEEIDRLVSQLEVHFLSNPDPELRFALLTDHVDTEAPPGALHGSRLKRAMEGISRLNLRYGKNGAGPFHLLHRDSHFNAAEGKWMGWERKRGKLEELNQFLRGGETTYRCHVGSSAGLESIQFVLTLDSDTALPPGAAARLVGTLAHPLNRPEVGDDGRVRQGYTVLQPRVAIAPGSARMSPFSRVFSGDTGIDIYTRAVSETYQDLFGEGIYVGKGIYDIDAFEASLRGRVPTNRIVSHDLLEGIHGRAALVTDIVVYEDYPPHYRAYLQRMHRWLRGDWQLIPWLLPRVPAGRGTTLPNRLGLVDRFKIADNLRRGFVAPAVLVLLLCGWFVLPGHPVFWTLAALLAPGAAAVWSIFQGGGLSRQAMGRWFLAVCFAPQESRTVLDAASRAIVRMFWTRRQLLEWTTAAESARSSGMQRRRDYLRALWVGPVLAGAVGMLLFAVRPDALPWAGPWLLLWVISPWLAWRISRPTDYAAEALDEAGTRKLRSVARRTWLFFETFVGPTDRWLPPDHFQELPRLGAAHRTSPTNIGLLLLSDLSAYDLGYIGPTELAVLLSNTLDTVEQLETHRGHILNWFDTKTLEPLEPRYVSTVDSGNLAGALIALANGCERVCADPPLRSARREGLRDAAGLMLDGLAQWLGDGAATNRSGAPRLVKSWISELEDPGRSLSTLVGEGETRIRAVEEELVKALRGDSASRDPDLLRELRVWLDRLRHQVSEAVREEDALLPPSLRERHNGENQLTIESIPSACEESLALANGPMADDRARLESAASQATALLVQLKTIATRARVIAERMDFEFLYDRDRRLFHIGYNASVGRLDPHHYDLLASEARLASFLAIAHQQVPLEHWFALGRPLTQAGRQGRALLSWGGSMFEYLMPRLLMRSHPDTLLHQSCEAAVDVQIAYGHNSGSPWGNSESGYALLDGQQAYQYRSFGAPGLGLRRGLGEDLVIAPYASLLALPYRAQAVISNIAALEELGAMGRYGLFEALDYHPERSQGRPSLVRSYMAHHHGMSLVAIDNYLTGDAMVDRFHADKRVQGNALLLDERVPVDVPAETPVNDVAPTSDVALTSAPEVGAWQPDSDGLQIWGIGNGSLSSLVTSDGGGGLRWHDIALTRWLADPLTDAYGTWIYVQDVESGEHLGGTAAPGERLADDTNVFFGAGDVTFYRRYGELSVRLRIAIAPADDVEIREVEVINEGDTTRRIRVVGCMEPALEAKSELGRHPAFSKLFLNCRPDHDLDGVVISRRPRDETVAPVVLFRVVGDRKTKVRVFEIDREAFLGRQGSVRAPAALSDEHGAPREHTLDALCACEATIVLRPGASRSVSFVTAVAARHADVVALGRRFGTTQAVRWALEDAVRSAARRVHALSVMPETLPVAQKMLTALLNPHRSLRAPEATLSRGRPSQSRLWGRGISGDEPIVVLRLHGEVPGALLGELLSVHRYLRGLGQAVDLVLVDDNPSGYVEDDASSLRRALSQHGSISLLHQRGGIHVVRTDQTHPHELAALEASAYIYLDANRGPLAQQLLRSGSEPALPQFQPAGPPPDAAPDPQVEVAVPDLSFDNGYGGFDGDEYVIRPGVTTPAPWCNVIANEQFGCLVSESSLGSSWSLNAGEYRLTPWHNDPVSDLPSEALYLRDEETGQFWTTTPKPAGLATLVRHGFGYTSYELACRGLHQKMTVFVPPGESVKIVRLTIRNASSRPRRLTATYYAEWVLGARRDQTRAHIGSRLSADDACLLARTSWSADFADRVAFLATDGSLHGHTSDRAEMVGRGGDMSQPAALRRWGLSGSVGPGLDPCAAIQTHIELAPGATIEVSFLLGDGQDEASALKLVRMLRTPGAIDDQWRRCQQRWSELLGAVRIATPDPALDRLCNGWLLYQSIASRFFGRTALYQSSGAFGFRDQLQDSLALLHTAPAMTRQHILESARHQFAEGDVLHWWHPPGDAGVRTRCSDDLLWLVFVTAEYVSATGDIDVLKERVPFLAGEALEPDVSVRYSRFGTGDEASLLEHCRRALSTGATRGAHGLPLIGDGDWNDGMNRVGPKGRGESVWLGWFLHACIQRFAGLLERIGETREKEQWEQRLAPLSAALSEHGWDGAWYRRAYDDQGQVLGSATSDAPHIDSIAQSWAALSGAGEPARVRAALASADRKLVREAERLVLLLTPPFDPQSSDPGYIAAYPAGVRENGGQYTHAAAWLGFAHAAIGDGDGAHRILSLLNPLERTESAADVMRYRVEPYVLAADVYGAAPWTGRGGWTWYTGASAWTWRLAIEGILGLHRREGALWVEPRLPSSWPGFEAWVRHGELTVHVVVHGSGTEMGEIQLDEVSQTEAVVPLSSGAGRRRLEIWMLSLG